LEALRKGGKKCQKESVILVGRKKMLKVERPAKTAILFVKIAFMKVLVLWVLVL